MRCMTVSLAHGGVGVGAGWGERLALSMLKDAGFYQVTITMIAMAQKMMASLDPADTGVVIFGIIFIFGKAWAPSSHFGAVT